MNREWRRGSIELLPGYALIDADQQQVSRAEGVDFAIEGGYVNVRLPDVSYTQLVSAPAVRLLTCDS